MIRKCPLKFGHSIAKNIDAGRPKNQHLLLTLKTVLDIRCIIKMIRKCLLYVVCNNSKNNNVQILIRKKVFLRFLPRTQFQLSSITARLSTFLFSAAGFPRISTTLSSSSLFFRTLNAWERENLHRCEQRRRRKDSKRWQLGSYVPAILSLVSL